MDRCNRSRDGARGGRRAASTSELSTNLAGRLYEEVHRLFFVGDSRTLFTLLLNSALEFAVRPLEVGGDKIDELPYLRIKKEIVDQLIGIVPLNLENTGYSAFEVDDFLPGHFEDVGWYVQRKLMDLNAAYQSFDFYVIATVEHTEMKKYLEDQRAKEYSYDDVEWLNSNSSDLKRSRIKNSASW